MGKQLFGTDGIRGVANRPPLTCDTAVKIGSAAARMVQRCGKTSLVIGKDTRQSGDMLESSLAAGTASQGIDVLLAGVIPTPGVAHLAASIESAGAGIVISASHNPYQDNGIKFFDENGEKASDPVQQEIEAYIDNFREDPAAETGRIRPLENACGRYADFLKKSVRRDNIPSPLRLVVDCSNGAAFEAAPEVFSGFNMDAAYIHCTPDGTNINRNCGSQHTQGLSGKVREMGADMGLAFDGDADRLIAVDEKGAVVTGDKILAMYAKHLKQNGELDNNLVVSTIMSNIGLTKCLHDLGIIHIKTDVGDRNVRNRMLETSAVIGGEDSGHMIFSKYHTTGDGILTALKLIETMGRTGRSLSSLADVMTVYPQILKNVPVDAAKPHFSEIGGITREIAAVEEELASEGRVLVRYSGTRPLLRVMIEGPDHDLIEQQCRRICDRIETYLGRKN